MPSISPRRKFEHRFVITLALCDVLVSAASVLAAYSLRAATERPFLAPFRHPLAMYIETLPLVAVIWLWAFTFLGMYRPRRTLSSIAARGAEFRAVSLATLAIAAASFFSHQQYSRLILVQFWVFSLLLTWAVRWLLGRYLRRAQASGKATSRAAIVGTGDLGMIVLERLRHYPFGLEPVGFVAADGAPETVGGLPVLGRLRDLPAILVEHNIDEVLVANPGAPAGELMAAIRESEKLHVEFLLVAGPLQVLTAQADLTGPADLPVVELRNPSFGPVKRLAKRLCDLLGALVLLLITSPLMVAIALAIRRQTGESALFRQTRVGYRGRDFVMYKFRTMRSDSEAYAPSPSSLDDQRITPIGRWLRKYSLDELPQLLNVAKGEMSIVGPRPEMPFMVAQYEPWQRRRLDAVPGMTGLWQIMGRKDLPLRDNIEYDFYYIRNQSLLLDLAIFVRTLPIVVLGRGAY